MAKPKPPIVKYPIMLRSKKVIYRSVRDIQQLKNGCHLATATINKQSCMVQKKSTYWVVV
ncbi:hypothetical protein [Nostoc sp. MS1]|uniref:hypothetical protein n=1 Tax=Nostoc sp. MS1 TaxID=2764711 RepID=UPI001CC727BE|nr:hypothetical protein [Nostoc sp. MS1]